MTILQHLATSVAKMKKEIDGPMPLDAVGRARRAERTKLYVKLCAAKTTLIAGGLSLNKV